MVESIDYCDPLGMSDHLALNILIRLYTSMPQQVTVGVDIHKADSIKIKQFHSEVDWNLIFQQGNIQDVWESFKVVLVDSIEKFAPKRVRNVFGKDTPWMKK